MLGSPSFVEPLMRAGQVILEGLGHVDDGLQMVRVKLHLARIVLGSLEFGERDGCLEACSAGTSMIVSCHLRTGKQMFRMMRIEVRKGEEKERHLPFRISRPFHFTSFISLLSVTYSRVAYGTLILPSFSLSSR